MHRKCLSRRSESVDTPGMRIRHLLLAISLGLLAVACSSVLSLEVGTCFDDPETFTEVTDVPIVDCAEPHDNEVIANFDIAGATYPGDDTVNRQAEVGCLERFEPYVGTAYADSIYEIGWLTPTASSWDDAGDREVICFVYDLTLAKITGSVEGSGR